MSIESCEKCQQFIDTDEYPEAYEMLDDECNEIKLEYPLCESCKDNFCGLIELKKNVDNFTSQIFDWVSLLDEVGFLSRCYEFSAAIEKYTNPKKGE